MNRRHVIKRLAAVAGGTILLPRVAPAIHAQPGRARGSVLQRSDVVFMYEADAATYRDYGATVLAWGGAPTPASLAEARGVTFYASVGMVTEFAAFRARFPSTWQQAVCLDVDGHRIKVPWLVDLDDRGEPYWWCCTRQPVFREFLEARASESIERGAHGLHVDDHLGSAGTLSHAGCFCDRCVEGFREHLASLDPAARQRFGIGPLSTFDYGTNLRRWRADAPAGTTRKASDHPLWTEWRIYHLRGAAAYMARLRSVAAAAGARPVPVSANAGVLWPNHLADYEAVDFFSAEIDHEAESRRVSDRPVFAYRIADAMERPLAATARGEDWALVLAEKRHRLALSWSALGYASGHMLMAPHHQWCHTEEKGTHWYDGPRDVFAPLSRFVREHSAWLDGLEAWADVALVVPHRSFAANPARWIAMGETLAAANLAWRVVIGGDEVVPHAIAARVFDGVRIVVNPSPDALLPGDRNVVSGLTGSRATVGGIDSARVVVTSVEEAIRVGRPAVRTEVGDVRVLPRVAPGRAVIHLVNHAYDPRADSVRPLRGVVLACDLAALGVPRATRARAASFGGEPRDISVQDGRLEVDVPGVWTMVELS